MQDQGFLKAICDDPHDTGLRLIYADWLEEHGQEEQAEFIRVQCELAEPDLDKPNNSLPSGKRLRRQEAQRRQLRGYYLRRRERELIILGHRADWYAASIRGDAYQSTLCYEWHHGFIEIISCNCADWLKHGPAIVRAHPVLEVKLTDGRAEQTDRDSGRWSITHAYSWPWDVVSFASTAYLALTSWLREALLWARGPHPKLGLEALPPLRESHAKSY